MAGQSVPIDTRPTHLEVLISGSTLSFLTFKLKNCHGDTEGFLYGHINTRINQEVSDMQEGIESVQKTITITDFVCFKNKFTFYDKCGRLDKVKCARVECLTRDTPANTRTVGWFSFRRNTTSGMSLREKYVHQGLWDIFSPVIDTFLHILLIETISVQLVLEQLSMCAYTYDTTPSGRHILTPHSIKILNLNVANTSKNRYKHPINTTGLTLTYSNTLDTILTPFSEQIGSKPPFLQSAQMITQISANTLERMCHMQQQILSNVKHIEKVKSEISILTHDPSYSEELIPSAPPSSILCPINKKHMEQHLPNKTAMDYNTYQHPDKIINQDPSAGLHPYNTGLFAPLELAPSHSDQPPPYTQISSGAYTGQLQIPYERSVPMDSSSTIAMGSFVNNNSNNNNSNNNNNNNNNNDNLFQTRFRLQPSNMKLNECIIVCSSEDESTA